MADLSRHQRKLWARHRRMIRRNLVCYAGMADRFSYEFPTREVRAVVASLNPNRIKIPRSLRRWIDEANRA